MGSFTSLAKLLRECLGGKNKTCFALQGLNEYDKTTILFCWLSYKNSVVKLYNIPIVLIELFLKIMDNINQLNRISLKLNACI